MANATVITVSQLNRYLKAIIDEDIHLQTVFVCGEISNFVNHRSGHYYFSLKDESSSIKALMFRSANSRLKFLPENNMKVICKGRISVFERDGAYQLYVDDMQPDGTGALAIAFEQLKNRLESRGYFDAAHKKAIPSFPQKVGVLTSPTGAAVRDIINVLSRRFPLCEMVFCPVIVQGDEAAQSIADAIGVMNKANAADVLIVGRGGGSIEDLWAFNEEIVADAVYNSEIPVISAVGHETDFTICDFVADLRAPTPSAAAELAVPDANVQKSGIEFLKNKLAESVDHRFSKLRIGNELLFEKLIQHSPASYVSDLRVACDMNASKIVNLSKTALFSEKNNLMSLISKLDALSPLKILGRGYSVVTFEGKTVSSVKEVNKGDNLDVRLSDGIINCTVM